jgi:hypothetical protein
MDGPNLAEIVTGGTSPLLAVWPIKESQGC